METCFDCGIERQWLHKHHLIPKSEGGSDSPENLVTLCGNCHEDRHGGPCGGSLRGLNAKSPEANAKRSQTLKAKLATPEYKKKWKEAHTKSWEGNAERRALASTNTKEWFKNNPEAAAERNRRISEAKKGKPASQLNTPEALAKRKQTLLEKKKAKECETI